MDPESFVLLSKILRELVSLNRPIENLEEIPLLLSDLSGVPSSSFLHATDPVEVEGQVNNVCELLEDARVTGMIHEWEVEREDGSKARRWDWSTKAYQQAESMGIILVNPLEKGKREDGL
jgi:hypothetical protein